MEQEPSNQQAPPGMTWLASVLPGVREIRGPLVAGYIWLLNVWLLLGPAPLEDNGSLGFTRLHELVNALGPVELAAAASVVAYLLGSLSVNLGEMAGPTLNRIWLWLHYTAQELEEGKYLEPEDALEEPGHRERYPLRELLSISRYGGVISAGAGELGLIDRVLDESLGALTEQELSASRAELIAAVEQAEKGATFEPSFQYLTQYGEAIARLPLASHSVLLAEGIDHGPEPEENFEIPTFSPRRDIIDAFPFLRGRLAEIAPIPSGNVERLFAEADFRTAIALPLVVLSTLLVIEAHGLWAISYALPIALLVQAYSLRRSGKRELVDALRARSVTGELQQITPAFDQFRIRMRKLVEAIAEAQWRPEPEPSKTRSPLLQELVRRQ